MRDMEGIMDTDITTTIEIRVWDAARVSHGYRG